MSTSPQGLTICSAPIVNVLISPQGIREETGYSAELQLLDLARFSSVLSFVDGFLKEGNRLDILVANAAITTTEYKTTVDGWEETYVLCF